MSRLLRAAPFDNILSQFGYAYQSNTLTMPVEKVLLLSSLLIAANELRAARLDSLRLFSLLSRIPKSSNAQSLKSARQLRTPNVRIDRLNTKALSNWLPSAVVNSGTRFIWA